MSHDIETLYPQLRAIGYLPPDDRYAAAEHIQRAIDELDVILKRRDRSNAGFNARIETINGTIQVSSGSDGRVGIIVERGDHSCGLLMSDDQARGLAAALTCNPPRERG